MSPQSSRRILLGKVLGVPVLLYLGIGVMLPLHLATGLMATYPLKILLGFYGLLGAIAACFYAAAMWFALLTPGLQGFQTWLVSGLSLALLTIGADASYSNSALDWFRLFDPLQLLAYWEVEAWSGRTAWLFASGADLNGFRRLNWFFWSAGQGGDEYLCLALPHALLLGAWFWRVLERKFQTPARTSLGKVQSYGLTLFLSLLIMGFNLQSSREFTGLWSYPISMGIYVVMLIFLLLPPHQAVLDWARYRHQQTRGQRSLAYDLLAHDGSPASLAVGVNFGIITGVLLLGISLTNQEFWMGNGLEPLLAWGLCSACLLNCALVVQWITLANLRHGHWITFATAAALILGWPMVLSMLGLDDYDSPLKGLWLTTAFPFAVMGNVVWTEIAGAIAAHLALLSGLSFCLSRRLQYLGQSEWKALQDSRSRPSLQSAQS